MLANLASLKANKKVIGLSDTSPVAWRTKDGVMVGHNGEAWLYRVMPSHTLRWESRKKLQHVAATLHTMLVDLGQTSRPSPFKGLTDFGASYREFHMVKLMWSQSQIISENTPYDQKRWLETVFDEFNVGAGLFAIGVKLWRSRPVRQRGFVEAAKMLIREAKQDLPDIATFATDKVRMQKILGRAGGRIPTEEECLRLESWWNGGRGSNSVIVVEPDGRGISCDMWPSGLEFSAVIGSDKVIFSDDSGLWLQDAFSSYDGCVALSIRGELHPPEIARNQFRKAQRKALNRQEEEAATGDLEREENEIFRSQAEMLESLFVGNKEPLIRNTSILFAREATPAHDTFLDVLESHWGIKAKVVEFRQKDVLDEMLPCGPTTFTESTPFSQDLTVGMISRSGISSFSSVGDEDGLWAGLTLPNMTPAWIDPLGSSKQNQPPTLAVLGEPGAGKTFFLQMLATQASYSDKPVVFINPKPADSLDGFAKACGGETIRLSTMETEPGMLDPFRFAQPEMAAEIAYSHILTVFSEFTQDEEVYLGNGLKRAAAEGARCVGDALRHHIVPSDVAKLILAQAEGSSLFALGISNEPQKPLGLGERPGLTLVEFDRALDIPAAVLPSSEYSRDTRFAVAAVRLICKAAVEQMLQHGGGVLIVDEAHVFLGSQEGRNVLQRLGREGRSQRILPILATQRIADIVKEGVDMESYLGRVIVMKMTDRREADTSLQLCGLEPDQQRREWLAQAGPIRGERPSMALYRDLQGRCSGILVGPVPEYTQQLFSTNPLDRELRNLELNPLEGKNP